MLDENSLNKQFAATRKMPLTIPVSERFNHTIRDVKTGDFIKISGKTYLVEEVSPYYEWDEKYTQKQDYTWSELKLFCLQTGETVNIEWEVDDEIEISLTTQTLKFGDLQDDEGGAIDDDDLDQIVEDEDSIFVNGKEFAYDDDYAAKYHRAGAEEGDKVYIYDFVANDGTCLTIEEWGEGERCTYNIYLSTDLNTSEVEVLALEGGGNA